MLLIFMIILVVNALYMGYSLVLLLLVAFLVLLERKVLGMVQIRKSPNIVSLWSLVQTVMDGVKLLIKQFFEKNKNMFFYLTPALGLFLSFLHWMVVPTPIFIWSSHYSILYSFVVMGLMVFVVLWSSWGSKSGYGLIGCVRGVAQMISYEVVFMFFLFCYIMKSGDFDWGLFMSAGSNDWGVVEFFLCVIWLVLILSELNRTPFDLVESESELVSGFNVEYSGYGFTLLFLSEYMNIWFMSFISGLVYFTLGGSLFVFWFLFLFLILWIRSVLPRFKFNQLISLMWGVYLPVVFMVLVWVLFWLC